MLNIHQDSKFVNNEKIEIILISVESRFTEMGSFPSGFRRFQNFLFIRKNAGPAEADAAVLLKDLGFEIREFGPTAYAVSAIPGFMDLAEAESFIDEFFSASSEGRSVQARRDQITMRACKSAVKAHDKLSASEIRRLLLDLDRCENPFSCPHGRPVFLKYSEYELERLFKRK